MPCLHASPEECPFAFRQRTPGSDEIRFICRAQLERVCGTGRLPNSANALVDSLKLSVPAAVASAPWLWASVSLTAIVALATAIGLLVGRDTAAVETASLFNHEGAGLLAGAAAGGLVAAAFHPGGLPLAVITIQSGALLWRWPHWLEANRERATKQLLLLLSERLRPKPPALG